ncbi:LAETG motif-containing sortase-dependent surface protein [Streptomyces sp. NPDC092296]|uniref:LAETG motif-containing sortase-dependent surface protein n=1 Tax=Streptomyces sp. NPDC092296 TaxID=3366012 RepID=UPI00381914AA
MARRHVAKHSPLAIAGASVGGAVLLALVLGPVASAASTGSEEVAAAKPVPAARPAVAAAGAGVEGLRLADTGSVRTTPYLLGGTAFLVVGGGLLYALRRREVEDAA